jgi:undecaprenyl-diphosphatase
VSSTAHLLIGEKLLGFQDPDGVFTIMIQLGSIFAIVWLYRVKIVKVVAALPSDPDARRFAAAVVVAVIPALVAGALLSTFVTSDLYKRLAVFAASFIIGGIVMLVVERSRPAPTILNAEHTPVGRAFGVGLCQMLAIVPGV